MFEKTVDRLTRQVNPSVVGEWAFLASAFTTQFLSLRYGFKVASNADIYLARLKDMINTLIPINNAMPNLSGINLSKTASETYNGAANWADRMTYKYSPGQIGYRRVYTPIKKALRKVR